MADVSTRKVCGIVMPISSIDGCTETHWAEVLDIINESVSEAGFDGNLVSHADEVGIIHKRIIQNLYENPIVVCDVSGKNPNVMFELGLRLAFDKPTIIIKDDKTSYSFDTSAIEHLEYPRDLRFSQIVEFKQKLSDKISATYDKSKSDKNYTTFLKHFGEFKVAKIDQKEISGQEYILEELKSLRRVITRLDRLGVEKPYSREFRSANDINICMGRSIGKNEIQEKMEILLKHPALTRVGIEELDTDHYHITAEVKPGFPTADICNEVEKLVGSRNARRFSKRIVERNAEG